MKSKLSDKFFSAVFLASALFSVGALLVICYFIFSGAMPAIDEIGLWNFLTGSAWKPNDMPPSFGIYNMLAGSVAVTAGAILVGVPMGLLTAVYLSKYAGEKYYSLLKQAVSLLAGIPSIIYGFFGMMIIVPFIQQNFKGNGNSLLAASLVLGIMILPTVVSICEDSISAVPHVYEEGSLALGATKERAICTVVLPAAKSGIATAIVLGIGRAIGETMAVVMVAGNSNIFPSSIFKSVRVLTANIVLEMSYASAGLHYDSLIATGAVLFAFVLLLNLFINTVIKRKRVDERD